MKRSEFIKQAIFEKLLIARQEGLKISESCDRVGISYQNEYIRHLTHEQRIELKHVVKAKPVNTYRALMPSKSFFDEVDSIEASGGEKEPIFDGPVKIPFYNDGGGVVC